MPTAFDKCVKNGGKVVRKSLPKDKYITICYDKEGNSHPGEVKTKKSTSELLDFIEEVVENLKS